MTWWQWLIASGAGYFVVWFLTAMVFARGTRVVQRCNGSCSGYIYHRAECRESKTVRNNPGDAAFFAIWWPVTIPMRAIEWSATYEPRGKPNAEYIAQLERELGLDESR